MIVALPRVPDEPCTRTHSLSGTRSSPKGYASRSWLFVAKGCCASVPRSTPKRSRSLRAWSSWSSGRGIVSSSGWKIGTCLPYEDGLQCVMVSARQRERCGRGECDEHTADVHRRFQPVDEHRRRCEAAVRREDGRQHRDAEDAAELADRVVRTRRDALLFLARRAEHD